VFAWLNLAKKGNVAVHPSTLSYFRIHKGSNSDPNANPNFIYAYSEWEEVVVHANTHGYLTPEAVAKAYRSLRDILLRGVSQFPQLSENLRRAEIQMAALSL
jgi:hypothetical protein